jgi:dihydropteroate synthase
MQHLYNLRFVTPRSHTELEAEIQTLAPEATLSTQAHNHAAHRLVRAERIPADMALLLRHELRALGGDALINPEHQVHHHDLPTDILLIGTHYQLSELVRCLRQMSFSALQSFVDELAELLQIDTRTEHGVLQIGDHQFAWGTRTYVMAIINVTPDSFSADGLLQPDVDIAAAALAQAQRAADEGADIIDVGGESTRPGAQPLDSASELARVIPAISAIRGALDLPISIDTYHADVAEAALDAGAQIINDIWGLRTPDGGWNEPLAKLAAERDVPIILMHNRSGVAIKTELGSHYGPGNYRDLIGEVIAELRQSVDFALSQGIRRENIIIDPGLGFGKSPTQNLLLMRRLNELCSLGLPMLVGASRKSFIGMTLNLPPSQRDEGTAAVTALAIQAGADIVRVHNVQMNVRAARISDAIMRGPFAKVAPT